VKNLKDIIKIVKQKELNSKYYSKLLYIISEKIYFGKNIKRKKNNEQFIFLDKENYLKDFEYKDKRSYNSINSEKPSILKAAINNKDTNYFENDNFLLDKKDTEKDLDSIFSLNVNNNDLFFLHK